MFSRFWKCVLVVSVGLLGLAVVRAVPLLTTAPATGTTTGTTAAETTADITQVGTSTTVASAKTAAIAAKVPAGTMGGDVLLTFVETRPGTKITCAPGAKLIFNRSRGSGTRLAGCLSVAGQSVPATVRVRISPKSQAVAVTMAFAGVDQGSPLDVQATSSSATSPSVKTSGRDIVVLGLGSSGLAAVATAPPGAQLQNTVNNSGHAQVAAATLAVPQGATGRARWGLTPSSLPVAATVALRPAPAPPVGQAPGSSAAPEPTISSPSDAGSSSAAPATSAPATGTSAPATSAPATSAPATSDAPSTAPASSASSTPAATPTTAPPASSSGSAPSSPPVTWCETGLPASPYASAPAGAVTVPSGDNSSVNFSTPNTTYWFAPGTHTLGTGRSDQIQTADGDTYVGAPGAVLNGQNANQYAFIGTYNELADEHVTIEYLTIENFNPDNGGGAVNGNGNNGWTEKYDLMKNNSPGAAMMLGGDNVVSDNCMTQNGEYGFNGYSYVDETYGSTFTGGATNITFSGNDLSYNNTQKTQSGAEGGGKFWMNGNVAVTGNYVHNNIDSPGLWMDTDNAGFLVQGNYISDNDGEGLFYEISYNADIIDNTFAGNAIQGGESNEGFPTGAIYVSESGGDASIKSNYAGELNIQGNVFNDNWGGVVVWQNANRYSGDGQDPGTLIPPSGTSLSNWINNAPSICKAHLSETTPVNYNALCQWRSQNVTVQGNTFKFNPSDSLYQGQCTEAHTCGQNALFSQVSSTAAYPGWSVCNNISNNQGNHFHNNTYVGPWTFTYFNQGDMAGPSGWQAGAAKVESSGDGFGAQDQGSSFTSS